VTKIIAEILRLLWKAMRLALWRWLKPLLGRLVFYVVVILALVWLFQTMAGRR
jgi:hypothetical protein